MSPPDATPTTALTAPPERLPTKPGGASIKLRQGTYIGATIEANPDTYPRAVDGFLGIPYAQSTAGKNRFRPAVPVPDSTTTFQAASYGHACLGANSGEPEGEDCLNANVFRPRDAVRVPGEVYGVAKPAHLLPVVIYVHGGGFNAGHGGERNMASFVSWAKEDIMAVSFNYRVGAFGFLPSALTAREGLLNLGLKDQQALFTWVQDNIAAFGGDPGNVTIMGLSAGAHSIGHHLMCYSRASTRVPFAKAILESGATTARATFYPTHPRHLVQFREFLVAAGVEAVPELDIFPTLRTLPAATILAASKAVWDKYVATVTWPFQPVIDGPNAVPNSTTHSSRSPSDAVIPDLPLLSWRQGRHLAIPVLTGFNTNEGAIFIPAQASTNAEFRSFFSALVPGFGPGDLDALEALYPDPATDPSSPYAAVPEGMGAQWARLDAAYSHYAYVCPVLQTAHFLSAASSSSRHDPSKSAIHNSYGLLRSSSAEAGEEAEAAGSSPPPPSGGSNNGSPVYLYRYAATSRWGAANHGDEAPVVAHDMLVVSPPAPTSDRPGLRKVADAMHAAWVNFVVSPTGNPNPVGGAEAGRGGEETCCWPAFVSPLVGGAEAERKDGGAGPGRLLGRMVVFGEGNDERDPEPGSSKSPGTPVGVQAMTEWELERCRFWWDRVELSEGVGRRLDRGRL